MQIQSQPEWSKQRYPSAQSGLGFVPGMIPQVVSGKPAAAELQLSGSDVKQNNKPTKAQGDFYEEKREGGHGNASTWMSLYKFCGPLVAGIGYGAVFGSPIGFAAGVSLIVSSLQAGAALKIHKEDTPWAKSIVRSTRKLMGREKDHSAAGKEWSMVPVWGAVCGLAGLVEAGINHSFAHRFPPQSSDDLRKKAGVLKPIFKLQAWCMDWVNRKIAYLTSEDFKKYLPKIAKEWPTKLLSKFTNKVQGNAKLGYIAGIGIAGIGGMLQSASAAKIQEHLDAKNAAKKQGHPAGKNQAEKSDGKNKPAEPEKTTENSKKTPATPEDKADKKPEKRRGDEAALPATAPANEQSRLETQQPTRTGHDSAKKPEQKSDVDMVSYVIPPQQAQPFVLPQSFNPLPPVASPNAKGEEEPFKTLKPANQWPMPEQAPMQFNAWMPTNTAMTYPRLVPPV